MKRVIVLGGRGWFGRAIVEQLAKNSVAALVAARRAGADVRIDANDRASIQSVVRRGDVLIDAAGPFHLRSTALIEAATEIGFDVIDINDDLNYAQRVLALEPQIAAANIRVLSSASTVSAISAAVVQNSGAAAPVRVSGFLAPASRHSANAGTAFAMMRSVGQPITIWRDGRLQSVGGWTEPRRFPMSESVGPITGRLFETADAVYLPLIWPSLRDVAVYVDTNTLGVNTLLRAAASSPLIRRIVEGQARLGTRIARWLGSAAGGVGYEIEDGQGRIVRYAISSREGSYLTAVAPVILAAREIAADRFGPVGLVMPDRQVEPATLFRCLDELGIHLTTLAN